MATLVSTTSGKSASNLKVTAGGLFNITVESAAWGSNTVVLTQTAAGSANTYVCQGATGPVTFTANGTKVTAYLEVGQALGMSLSGAFTATMYASPSESANPNITA